MRVANAVICSETISKIKSEKEEKTVWGEIEGKIANDGEMLMIYDECNTMITITAN